MSVWLKFLLALLSLFFCIALLNCATFHISSTYQSSPLFSCLYTLYRLSLISSIAISICDARKVLGGTYRCHSLRETTIQQVTQQQQHTVQEIQERSIEHYVSRHRQTDKTKQTKKVNSAGRFTMPTGSSQYRLGNELAF